MDCSPYFYVQSLEYFGVFSKAPVTRSEPALFCGFFASMPFRRFLHIVSKISSVMKKSMYSVHVQDELFSGLQLTNLGEM
jgi:hypothetical protein